MSRFHSYINTSTQLIKDFKGEMPFALFLRSYFAANKKYGSKDRKQIASLCYNFFRLGHACIEQLIEQKIVMATFLCEQQPSELLQTLMPEWNKLIDKPVEDKIAYLKSNFNINDIFPYKKLLSPGIDAEKFNASFLRQPDLFLRIRPKTNVGVLKKLEKINLDHSIVKEDCIVLPNSTKVEEYFLIDKEVIIQDYNSQKVFDFFIPLQATYKTALTTVWDCCAASGGKSILLFDIFNQHIELTVSDIRPSIILNLHQRFNRAGLKTYNYFIADVDKPGFQHPIKESSIIICDAPCTGSGTWARTPEQLYFFDKISIENFTKKQKNIATNVIPYLKKDGLFVYITCSVFKQENEDIAVYLSKKFDLNILHMEVLKGYDKKADSMFVAVLQKN